MSFWQLLTLANFPALEWVKSSFVMRLIGLLQSWRSQSVLAPYFEAIGVILVSVIFAVAPLVANSYTGFLLLASGAIWGLLTLSDARSELKLIPSHFLLGLYWLCAFMATVQSPVKAAAASGLVKLTLYLLGFLLMERVMHRVRWRNVLVTVYLLSALFVTVYGIKQYLYGAEALATWVDPTSSSADQVRVYSYLGNPNLLAGYLLPAIPLGIGAVFNWKGGMPKLLAVGMTVLNLICLYGTGSRGGWIGAAMGLFTLGLMLLYWILPRLPKALRKYIFPLFFLSIVLVISAGLVSSTSFRNRALSVFAGREDSSNNFRINVWDAVKEMIRDRPILGIGPGNAAFNLIYPLYQRPNYSALGAYSIYLEMLVEVGFLGFAIFYWFLLTLFARGLGQIQRLRQQSDTAAIGLMSAIAAMIAMLVHGLVDTVWYRPEVATVWWLMVAVSFSYLSQTSQPEQNSKLI